MLSYHARYIITGMHALLHIGSITTKNRRDVYVLQGCRENISYYSSYFKLDNINYHILGYKPDENRKCLGDDKCCTRDVTSESKLEGRRMCLNIVERDGEKIASCMNAIDENEIVENIKKSI